MTDQRIDSYIAKSQPFAQPVLKKLRLLIHKACPGISETIKWGMPAFEYMGPLCGFGAFKTHCVFVLHKADLLIDSGKHLKKRSAQGGDAMGHFGRITALKDLPPDKAIIDFIKQAVKLNENVKSNKKSKSVEVIPVSETLESALNKNKKAEIIFNKLAASHKKEYLKWIAEAKTEKTRVKRIHTTIEMLMEKQNIKTDTKK